MRLLLVLTTIVSLLAPSSAQAQMYPFSQRGTVGQTLAFTDIAIEYGRPTARGRELFGALVPWDKMWHPGADDATSIRFAQAVEIEGRPLAAGAYSIWLLPRATGTWTLILNRSTGISHTPYPGESTDALRLELSPSESTYVETLTYAFPVIEKEEATLRLQWGALGVNLRIKAPYRPGANDANDASAVLQD